MPSSRASLVRVIPTPIPWVVLLAFFALDPEADQRGDLTAELDCSIASLGANFPAQAPRLRLNDSAAEGAV